MSRSPAEMTPAEMRSRIRRVSGFTPPTEDAPDRDWARFAAAFTVSIALKHFGDRDRALQWARGKLAEMPNGAAATAILDEAGAGAQRQQSDDKSLLADLLA